MVHKINSVGIENQLLLVRSDIVENGHLLVAHNYETLLFEGMKPTNENMGATSIGETQAGNGIASKNY